MDMFLIVSDNLKKIIDIKKLKIVKNNKENFNIYYLKINKKILDKIIFYCYNNKKNKLSTLKIDNLFYYLLHMYYFIILHILIKKINNIFSYKDGILIYSKNLKNNEKQYNCLHDILNNKNLESNVKELIQCDTILKNDIKNIDKYIIDEKINIQKLRILLIIKNALKFDFDRLFRYLDKYKFVDILKVGDFDKDFFKKINNINKEYGTSVEIKDTKFKNKNAIYKYNIYINFDCDEKLLNSGYLLNKKSLYLDMQNSETDRFNVYKKVYDKYKDSYSTKYIDINDFNVLDIGYIYKKICT